MPLQRDALQLILDQNLAAAGKSVTTFVPTALVPDSTKLVSLERYQPLRARFRGNMATNSLADFGEYVLQRNGAGAKGFVDQDEMSCRVFFNIGDTENPGHADDIATLQLKPTAAYKALQAIAGKRLSQKDLAEWMEDWHVSLRATDANGADMPVTQAIAAVRNITIKAAAERTHVESNFSASRSAMDSIEAASQDRLPEALHFSFAPFEGLGIRVFTLRLSILTGDEKPALKPRWVGEEIQREEIAAEFKAVLNKLAGGAATLYLGAFQPGN